MGDFYEPPPERGGGCISAVIIGLLVLVLAGLLFAAFYFGMR